MSNPARKNNLTLLVVIPSSQKTMAQLQKASIMVSHMSVVVGKRVVELG
jgi:hypothetical protein